MTTDLDLFAILAAALVCPVTVAATAAYSADLAVRDIAAADGVTFAAATAHRCRRCSGRGTLAAYLHVQNGTCFRCSGTGVEEAAEVGAL